MLNFLRVFLKSAKWHSCSTFRGIYFKSLIPPWKVLHIFLKFYNIWPYQKVIHICFYAHPRASQKACRYKSKSYGEALSCFSSKQSAGPKHPLHLLQLPFRLLFRKLTPSLVLSFISASRHRRKMQNLKKKRRKKWQNQWIRICKRSFYGFLIYLHTCSPFAI